MQQQLDLMADVTWFGPDHVLVDGLKFKAVNIQVMSDLIAGELFPQYGQYFEVVLNPRITKVAVVDDMGTGEIKVEVINLINDHSQSVTSYTFTPEELAKGLTAIHQRYGY